MPAGLGRVLQPPLNTTSTILGRRLSCRGGSRCGQSLCPQRLCGLDVVETSAVDAIEITRAVDQAALASVVGKAAAVMEYIVADEPHA